MDRRFIAIGLFRLLRKKRDFKIEFGCDALEDLFEEKQFDYLDKTRKSLV